MGIFKFIFKLISLITFFILAIIAVAVWKGGEPFRWVGEGTVIIGKAIIKFGDTVDEIKKGGEKVGEHLIEMKETMDSFKKDKTDQEKSEQKKEGPEISHETDNQHNESK